MKRDKREIGEGSDRDGTDIEDRLERGQIRMGQILKIDWRGIR